MIKLESLNKYYNKGKQNEIHVVNDVSFELPSSGMVALFGRSGSGKTTLLNLIGGLDSYDSGALLIDGQEKIHKNDTARNKYIGYVFQNYNLDTTRTCRENVADALYLCGMTDAEIIEERVSEALRAVGMEKFANRRAANLSGGQQQRISIARAIVKNPPIILADEPTGNLDESNTVKIMNLLKAISKDRLVLIVTHEESLVDYYCDKVIELSDGKIARITDNAGANGYSARQRSDIYLGELDKTITDEEYASIEYYGNMPNAPIKLKIINTGGAIYLKAEGDGIKLIDSSSEIKIHEGVFEKRTESEDGAVSITPLPPVDESRMGRMFTLKSSIKSGFRSSFRAGGKLNKLLITCMMLFSAIVVFTSSIFGTSIRDMVNIDRSYNHNTFYVLTDNGDVSDKLLEAVGKADTGIDFVTLKDTSSVGDDTIRFNATGGFETFLEPSISSSYSTNAVFLSSSLAQSSELLAGRREGLGDEEILISRQVADRLLEKSPLGYIDEYKDLIGLISTDNYSLGGMKLRIAGVVDSDEPAVYLTDMAMAQYATANTRSNVFLAPYGIDVNDGEVIIVTDNPLYTYDSTLMIQGKSFTVGKIMRHFTIHDYEGWLMEAGAKKLTRDEFIYNLTVTRYPSITPDTTEFYEKQSLVFDECYYEYTEYYYAEYGEFLKYSYVTSPYPEFELWLYAEKGVEDGLTELIGMMPEAGRYPEAIAYKAEHGRYPSRAEAESITSFPSLTDTYKKLYEQEYYNTTENRLLPIYYVSENDFITLSKRVGKSSQTQDGYRSVQYTLVHSSNPELTEAWLNENLADGVIELITPEYVRDSNAQESKIAIVAYLVSMLTRLVIMCVCMYFIMRSSLMNRVKTIGIYRAIGASKRNIRFKFLVEALVITVCTVVVGYCASSAVIFAMISSSPAVSEVMYYPVWFAIVMLLVLVAITVLSGIIPIGRLLRKTPSEIISKYDI